MINGLVLFVVGLLLGKLLVRLEVRKKGSILIWLVGIPTVIFLGSGWYNLISALNSIYNFLDSGFGEIIFITLGIATLIVFIKLYESEIKREEFLYELEKKINRGT